MSNTSTLSRQKNQGQHRFWAMSLVRTPTATGNSGEWNVGRCAKSCFFQVLALQFFTSLKYIYIIYIIGLSGCFFSSLWITFLLVSSSSHWVFLFSRGHLYSNPLQGMLWWSYPITAAQRNFWVGQVALSLSLLLYLGSQSNDTSGKY